VPIVFQIRFFTLIIEINEKYAPRVFKDILLLFIFPLIELYALLESFHKKKLIPLEERS